MSYELGLMSTSNVVRPGAYINPEVFGDMDEDVKKGIVVVSQDKPIEATLKEQGVSLEGKHILHVIYLPSTIDYTNFNDLAIGSTIWAPRLATPKVSMKKTNNEVVGDWWSVEMTQET